MEENETLLVSGFSIFNDGVESVQTQLRTHLCHLDSLLVPYILDYEYIITIAAVLCPLTL